MTKEEEKYTTLDIEQCKLWVNTLFNMAKEKACNSHNFDDGEEIQSAQDKIIKTLETVEEFEKAQIITGGRLNGRTYAYKCGLEDGKRKALEQQPSDDCVSRQAVIDAVENIIARYIPTFIGQYEKIPLELARAIKGVPTVTPTHGMCKDCTKSKILNRFEGYSIVCSRFGRIAVNPDFYCADFEKRGAENE